MNGFLSMWISFYCYVLQIEVRKNAGRIEMEVRFAFCQLRTLLADCLYLFPTLCMMKSLLSVSNYIEHSQQHIQMRCICQWLPFRKWYENPFGVVAPLYLLRASCTRLLLTWMRFYFIDNSFWPSENGWISPDDTLLYKHQCTIRSIVAKYNLRAVNEIIGKSFVQSSIWQWYNTHTHTHRNSGTQPLCRLMLQTALLLLITITVMVMVVVIIMHCVYIDKTCMRSR